MRCPFCTAVDSKVVDSRDTESGIRRRRECLSCGKRFTTYERIEAVPFYVVKKDGRREEFNRQKLVSGLVMASKKRDVAPERLEALVDDVENTLRSRNLTEAPSRQVGEMIMERLRDVDEIAYIRFASVYRSFKDANQMRSEIEDILAQPPGTQRAASRRRRGGGDDTEPVLNMGK
ncbi:MAG: transcriptional regulator NrdR [Candidatus Dormibacteria bacterium]